MYLPRFALTRRRAVLLALALGMMAAALPLYSRWQDSRSAQEEDRFPSWEKDRFTSLTPGLHYWYAMGHLNPRRGEYEFDEVAANTSDLNAAILHLEAIPADSREYAEAADLLSLVRMRRDRPQDFPAAEEARFLSCIARDEAKRAEVQKQVAQERPCRHVLTSDGKCVTWFCTTGLSERCAPLADRHRLAQLSALAGNRP